MELGQVRRSNEGREGRNGLSGETVFEKESGGKGVGGARLTSKFFIQESYKNATKTPLPEQREILRNSSGEIRRK